MVRIHPDPPTERGRGAIAQLGERLLCKQEVTGSIPVGSTRKALAARGSKRGISNQRRSDARLIGASSREEVTFGCSLTIWDRR